VRVAVRAALDVFGATENESEPEPDDEPFKTDTHEALEAPVHAQPAPASRSTWPGPPVDGNDI
jgi:hypothetical protein